MGTGGEAVRRTLFPQIQEREEEGHVEKGREKHYLMHFSLITLCAYLSSPSSVVVIQSVHIDEWA